MIEVATGVAFLMSSLYGAGQANAQTAPAVTAPTTTAPAALAMTLTSPSDIEKYVRQQYADEPILVDVARCESTFRQYDSKGNVIRGLVNRADVGVMQINEIYHGPEAEREGYDIYTVQGNVAFAKHLYEKFGTSPWDSSKPCWSASSAIASK